MKTVIGTALTIAVMFVSGCGKQSTPEQTFDSIMAIVRDIESGKRPNNALNEYFYSSPREQDGYGDIERIKMRALHQVILSRIASYSFGDKTAIDASTVQLTIHFTYKDPGVGSVGTDETTFVFVKDGRKWKMDCGPRFALAKDNRTNVSELVRELSVKGEKSADASIALIKLGSPAVPEICRALNAMKPALDSEADVSLLFGGITTLAFISEKEPSTMGDAVSCLLRTAIKTSNNQARTYIVCSIQLFGPSAVSYLMSFLDSEMKNPPPEDPDTIKAQGLVSAAIINMVKVKPLEADAVIDQLKKCLDTASGKLKPVIIFQIANLAPVSKSVIGVLQEQLQSANDPAFKKEVQTALEFARQNSPK